MLAFWLETAYLRPFLGNIFSIWRHPSSWPPKGPPLGGNASFEPFSVRISATVRPGRVTEKKNSITKKSQRCYIFPIWPGFKLKSLLVTILQGVDFLIFLLIFAWALQQCSANAPPVINYGRARTCCHDDDKTKRILVYNGVVATFNL